MKAHGPMIKTIMDDLKDTNMLIDWAWEAKERGDTVAAPWFAGRAKERFAIMEKGWADVSKVIKPTAEGGEAEIYYKLLCHHVSDEMKETKERLMSL